MASLPSTLYVVVRDYGDLSIGSNDATGDDYEAFDQFAEAVEKNQPVMVLRIATTGMDPLHVSDATDEFERDLHNVCEERGLDWPDVIRFDGASPLPMAAE
ncbi:hypothetical protein [Paracoccus sp. (in: a-proteobacteria)]|uniref:hypothetical protein n=1 Tax=Paracoccus sp. TaxID=267 RepID=UPI002AFFF775|nr:hypothetical protein [Paracoccus sp. (in: a-proteobacteria)]